MQARKPDALRDAEARVRALTYEVGTLREELKRECKRRERAVLKAKEADDSRQVLEHQVNELRYSNKKLTQELEATQGSARAIAERNRNALQHLQEGLASVEAAVEERSQAGYQHVQSTFGLVQRLQRVLYPAPSAPHCSPSAPAAATIISDIFRSLSALGTLLTSAAGEKPLQSPRAAAAAAAAACSPEVEQLCDKVGQLSQRLQDATSDKLALQNRIADLEQQLASLTSGPQAALGMAAVAELEAEKAQLVAQVQQLQEQCQALHDQCQGLQQQCEQLQQQCRAQEGLAQQVQQLRSEVAAREGHLQLELAAREQQLQEQQAVIQQLRSSISEQQDDIRSALSLVARRAPPPSAAAAVAAAAGLAAAAVLQHPQQRQAPAAADVPSLQPQLTYAEPHIQSPRAAYQQPTSPPQQAQGVYPSAGNHRYSHSVQSSPYQPLPGSPLRSAAAPSAHSTPAYTSSSRTAGSVLQAAFQPSKWQPQAAAFASNGPAAPAAHASRACAPGSLAAGWPAKPAAGAAAAGPRSSHHISRLKLDMQSLDAEIADLEASLKSAASRLT